MQEYKYDKNALFFYGDVKITWLLAMAENRLANLKRVTAEDMTSFHIFDADTGLTLEWHGHPVLGDDFMVRACFKKDNDMLLSTIEYCGNSSSYDIEEIIFPIISVPRHTSSRLLNPLRNEGSIDPFNNESKRIDCSCSVQFIAYLNDEKKPSYYFDCRDSEHYNKAFEFDSTSPDELVYRSVYFVSLSAESRKSHALPYPCGFQLFHGSWYEAAQIYREWALKQSWYVNRRKNPRLREIGMWFWNRGSIENVVPPVEKFTEDAGVPAALDWYWWHHNPYDTFYPDFWPPREGENAFNNAVERMNQKGIFSQVYTNGMTWDLDGESFNPEDGAESALVQRDGTIRSYPYNRFNNHRLAFMCGESKVFQKKFRSLMKELHASGLPGVYMDMIGCNAYLSCYNPRHNHAPGGGAYQHKGFADFINGIRSDNPGIILSTETPCEMMNIFDSMIELQSSMERCDWGYSVAVPVFSAIYHGEGISIFGSYALPDSIPPWDPLWPDAERWKTEKPWHKLFPEQFFIEVARSIVWGIQPCVCNFQMKHITDSEFVEEYEFIKRTARFYYANRDFLYDGRMLSPGELETELIEVEFLVRMVFTKDNEYKTKKNEFPAILHSVWEAPDGRRAVILANYTRQEHVFKFKSGNISLNDTIPARDYRIVPF